MLVGVAHIGRVAPGDPDTLPHQPQDLGPWQAAGILGVARIHHIGDRTDRASIVKAAAQADFAIDHGHLLALAQIGKGVVGLRGRGAKGYATARSAAIEPEHEAWLCR